MESESDFHNNKMFKFYDNKTNDKKERERELPACLWWLTK